MHIAIIYRFWSKSLESKIIIMRHDLFLETMFPEMEKALSKDTEVGGFTK